MVNAEGVVPQSIESISKSRAPKMSIARSQYAVALTVQIAASIVFTREATVLVVWAQDMVAQFMENGGHHPVAAETPSGQLVSRCLLTLIRMGIMG